MEVAGVSVDEEDALGIVVGTAVGIAVGTVGTVVGTAVEVVEEVEEVEEHMDAGRAAYRVREVGMVKACTAMGTARGSAWASRASRVAAVPCGHGLVLRMRMVLRMKQAVEAQRPQEMVDRACEVLEEEGFQ